MRVLFVTQIRPWPLDCGGAQRTFALVRALASKHEITLAVTRPGSDALRFAIEAGYEGLVSRFIWVDAPALDPEYAAPEPGAAVRVTRALIDTLTNWLPAGFRTASRPWRDTFDQHHGEFDAALCRQSLLAPSLMGLGLRRVVIDCDDLLFLYGWRSRVEQAHILDWIRAAVGAMRTWLAEQILSVQSGWTLACSEEDADRLLTRRKTVVPNAVTLEAGPRAQREADTVVFVGNMAYRPNSFGIRWFVAEVWPLVRASRPSARLRVVGLEATYERLPFARSENIELIPDVPSVKPWIESAVVSVVPILTGGGTKIKILESLGYGTPVVSTPVGAVGLTEMLDASSGLDVVEGSAKMAARICDVLANPEPAAAAAERGAKVIATRYAWDHVVRPLVDHFEAWVGAR